MITLIILIILIIIAVFLISTDFDLLGIIMSCFFGTFLMFHILFWGLASYEYNLFIEERNAFEQTLKEARKNGKKYENAAIAKEVASWNMELAKYKYQNKTMLLDCYVDDRFESLEPIK